MILSDNEIEERLNSPDNIVNIIKDRPVSIEGGLRVVPDDSLVGKRGPAVPDLIRKLIANVANKSDETQAEIGSVFSVGVPTVSNASRGLIHNRLDTELQDIANKSREEKAETAHNLALDSLVATLGLVGQKLDTITTAKEATQIAVSMSNVVKNLKDKDDDGPKIKTLVVIKMPDQHKESQFNVIDV